MAAGATYEPITTTTLTSTTLSNTFSSITSAYTDLVIVVNAKGASGADLSIRFNSDTSSLYSMTGLEGTGAATSSFRRSNASLIQIQNNTVITTTNFNFNSIIFVLNYANTTTNKAVLARCNNAENGVIASSALYRSTSAITSVTLIASNSGFASGTTLTLYGIKAA
jgi:hypothetical protein